MFIHIDVESFRNAVSKVLTVVDKKSTRPILSYTLIRATQNTLELVATDLEVSAKLVIPATVEKTGQFCVNVKNLFDILRELPNGTLSISVIGSTMDVNCADIHYSLMVYGSEDYPNLNFDNLNSKKFEMESSKFLEIINRTSYAISTDETRLFLNGIFLQDINSRLRAVATDGHRLAMIEVDIDDLQLEPLINGVIIPRKGIFELKKMTELYPHARLEIKIDDSFLFAKLSEEYFLSIRLIGREYPKYQAVIPSKTTRRMIVDRDLFLNAVKRIKIMSNEKTHGIKLSLLNSEMVIAANHQALGHANEKIPVDYNDQSMEIGFNAKYLIDTFSSLNSGDVTLEFNNDSSVVIVKSSTLQDFLGVIMPLKL